MRSQDKRGSGADLVSFSEEVRARLRDFPSIGDASTPFPVADLRCCKSGTRPRGVDSSGEKELKERGCA